MKQSTIIRQLQKITLMLYAFYPLRAAVCAAVVTAFVSRGLGSTLTGTLGPADRVTALRAGLVSLLAGFIGATDHAGVATAVVWIAVAAAVLDAVDGWIARHTESATAFGARFDMEVDALFILVLGALVWQFGKAGAWVMLSGVLRYVFVGAGLALDWLQTPLRPSLRRKAVCVVQVVSLIVAAAPVIAWPFSATTAAIGLLVLVWSFAVDVMWLHRHRAPARAGVEAAAALQV